MKQVIGVCAVALALATMVPDTVAAQQGTQGTQTQEQQQPGAADRQDTGTATGTSGMQQQGTQNDRQQDQGSFNAAQNQNELPSTASPLALILLGGVGALTGGLALRRARR